MTDTATTELDTTDPDPEAAGESVELTNTAGVTLSRSSRTISGVALPLGVIGERSSVGPILFTAGSLRHHPDLRRIKLLINHDQDRAVGYATALDMTDAAVMATFYVPPGADGDDALDKASNGVRDALSVGADIRMAHLAADQSHKIVTEAVINEVSLVSLPAFADARITNVTAARKSTTRSKTTPDKENTPMTDTNTAAEPDTEPTEPEAVEAPANTAAEPEAAQYATPTNFALAPAPYGQAVRGAKLSDVAASVANVMRSGGGAAEVRSTIARLSGSDVTAALSDVIPSNDAGHGFFRDGWLGELWEARRITRPVMEAFGPIQTLTKLKETGWRWTTRPQVGPYAGDKAEIPSNAVATEPAEVTAERMAGGWDVDRIYVDLGDADMIEALFRAAVEDYTLKSEAWAVAKINASATAVPAQASLSAALVELGTRAGAIGATLGMVSFAPDVWATFLGIPRNDLPWWINQSSAVSINEGSVKIGDLSLSSNPSLAAGSVIAGDRRAVTFKETRVRVQALDIPNGGVDLGVFAYLSYLANDARALFKTTIGTV